MSFISSFLDARSLVEAVFELFGTVYSKCIDMFELGEQEVCGLAMDVIRKALDDLKYNNRRYASNEAVIGLKVKEKLQVLQAQGVDRLHGFAGCMSSDVFFSDPLRFPLYESFELLVESAMQAIAGEGRDDGDLSETAIASMVNQLRLSYLRSIDALSRTTRYEKLKSIVGSETYANVSRQAEWDAYRAYLVDRFENEPIRGFEDLSLAKLYVDQIAYHETLESIESPLPSQLPEMRVARQVVMLKDHLESWLKGNQGNGFSKSDRLRVVSGVAGSGKSSFARRFAACLSQSMTAWHVLLVPLRARERSDETLESFMRRYFEQEQENEFHLPHFRDFGEAIKGRRILYVFDGLDELTQVNQPEMARRFADEAEKLSVNNRVLVLGRDLPVHRFTRNYTEFSDGGESLFEREQVIHMLPFHMGEVEVKQGKFHDPSHLLEADLRRTWWGKFRVQAKRDCSYIDRLFGRSDTHQASGEDKKLLEVLDNPIGNYLVAYILPRVVAGEKLSNLNDIYLWIVEAMFEWHRERAIRSEDIAVTSEEKRYEFSLQGMALAAWANGNSVSATRNQIEGMRQLGERDFPGKWYDITDLDSLMLIFFIRASSDENGILANGSVEFTHKSFVEYLVARRLFELISVIAERNPIDDADWRESWLS